MIHEYEGLRFTPIDMDSLRKAQDDWSRDHAEPEPPQIELTPQHKQFTVKLAREAVLISRSRSIRIEEAEREVCRGKMVDDTSDESYIEEHKRWSLGRSRAAVKYILENHVIYDVAGGMNLLELRAEDDEVLWYEYGRCEAFSLVSRLIDNSSEDAIGYMLSNSALTWEHIRDAGRRMGVTRSGKPILEVSTGGGGESQPIFAIGVMAASEVGVPPHEYKKLEIKEQAEIAATFLTRRLLDYWAAEDARRKVG